VKVVHVITGLDIGGTENVLLDLAVRQVGLGDEVLVVSLRARGALADALNAAKVIPKCPPPSAPSGR